MIVYTLQLQYICKIVGISFVSCDDQKQYINFFGGLPCKKKIKKYYYLTHNRSSYY